MAPRIGVRYTKIYMHSCVRVLTKYGSGLKLAMPNFKTNGSNHRSCALAEESAAIERTQRTRRSFEADAYGAPTGYARLLRSKARRGIRIRGVGRFRARAVLALPDAFQYSRRV